MGRFDNTGIEDFLGQEANPAAPAGAQQMAGAAADYQKSGNRYRQGQSKLGEWLAENSYTETSKSWFSGANQEGTNNGWDNQFVENFTSGWTTALEEGTAKEYFQKPDATGVVTWDHEDENGNQYVFGDVYEDGKKTGNLFDLYERDEANLMLAPWILDPKVQAETFAASDRMERLNREVEGQRKDRNENFEKALDAKAFQGDVTERAEEFQDSWVDEAITGGGAAGGAALGAGIGSLVPGAGTLAGGIIGGIAGGVGAFLNRDSLSEQAARAYEITSMSYNDMGLAAGISTGISQWSGFGSKLIAPTSNLVQGIYDTSAGRGGDGVSEFYRVDEEGKNTAPAWVKVADVTATVGDSLLQFASPTGLALYTTQMTGVIGGEVAELSVTGGKTFDYRRGGFDNIFTDDEGNTDLSSAAAGIGKIGIDVVQLGMARGLAGSVNASRAAVGDDAAFATLQLPMWMGGSRGLAAGEERVRAAGFSFTRGADGAIVEGSRRATLGLLAPSEQIAALSARAIGMREAARRGGAYTADDFYRGANAMAMGERKIQTALVNGFGEGYEEGLQAILEPHSHGASATAGEIFNAAAYGAAAGVGMSSGFGLRAASADERMYSMAAAVHQLSTGGEMLDRNEWMGLTDVEKRSRAAMSGLARETLEAAYRRVAEDQAIEMHAGTVGAAKLRDAVQSQLNQQLARGTDRTDAAFVITQLEDVTQGPNDAVTSSALQLFKNLGAHGRGMVIGLQTMQANIERAEAAVAADPTDTEAQAQLAAAVSQRANAELAIEWNQRLIEAITPAMQRIGAETATPESIEAEVVELNDLLVRAFTMEVGDYQGAELTAEDKTALARAVSLVFVRDPQDQAGSFQVLVPQASPRLTISRSDNVLEISHALLPAISGDYDGDKIRQQAQLVFDENEFTSARSGAYFLGVGDSVNIGAPKYEKYNVEQLAEALNGSNVTLASYADATLAAIGRQVRDRYAGVIQADTLDQVLTGFNAAVRANDKDARAALLDGLAAEAGGQITEFGRGRLSNEWLWLDQLIVSSFQRFQESYAAHRPTGDVDTRTLSPNAQTIEVRERRAQMAATLGQSLALFAPGDSLFRKFQKLHYTAINAPVLSANNLEVTSLTEMAMLYRELGQGVTRSELETIRGKDDITARVYAQLQKIAADAQSIDPQLSRGQAVAVIANLRVADLAIDENGVFTDTGKQTSLAQMLLKQSLMQDRREKARVFDASPELQAKHARLLNMTRPTNPYGAEQAFIEVVGAQQLYALLGDDAGIFGPHLTVEQFVRQFAAQSDNERREMRRVLQAEPAYLGRKQSKDMPYNLDEVQSGEVTAYRAMVDAILAVGSNRISFDEATGKLHGEIADRSDRTSADFREAHTQARAALREFAGLSPRQDGELSVDVVQRMLESNPDFARSVMNLVPNAAAAASFQVRSTGEVYASNWLYTLFTISDPKQAEMHYYRNLLLAEWNALGIDVTEEAEDGHAGRRYDRLKRRMHRTMYRLAAYPDGGLRLRQFVNELESATDLESFMSWVNRTPGMRGDQAPLVAWVDDTAEFDADKAQGGWTTALAGAELREAVASLKQRSQMMVDSLVLERAAAAADTRAISAIRKVIRKDRGEDVQLEAGDRETYQRFVKTIELAGDRLVSMGPQAMIYQSVGAVQGFYSSAHTKGKNPPNVEPAGSFDAARDAFDYVTNYERLMASLTTANLDAVGNNLAQVAKDGGRTMDAYGRTVEWTQPSPEQMLELLDNPETKPLARAILFPQVMERDGNGVLRPQFLVGKSLSELLRGVSFKELFPRNESLSNDAAYRYVSMVEGVARKFGGHFAVQRAVNDIVLARTSITTRQLSEYDIEQMVTEAYREVAQVLQAVGSIASQISETDMLQEMSAEVRKTQRRLRTARMLGMSADEAEAATDFVLDTIIAEQESELTSDINTLLDQIAKDPANEARYQEQIDQVGDDLDRFKTRVELLRSDDLAGQVVDMFSIVGDATEQASKKQAVLEYIATHMSVLQRASAAKITLNKLTQQMLDPSYNGQPNLTDKEWGELSRSVIGIYLDDVVSTSSANVSVSPWPDADRVQDQKYFDPTYSYLVEDLMRSDGPLAQAAVEVHRLAGRQAEEPMSQARFYDLLGRTILDEKRLGPWTSDIPRAAIEANQRLDSSAAAPAIAMAGNSPKRQAAIIAATRRTSQRPLLEHMSTATLSWVHLNSPDFDEVPMSIGLPSGPLQTQRPLAQINNRFAEQVLVSYPRPDDGTVVTVNMLEQFPNVGRVWFGDDSVGESGMYEIHTDRIKKAVDKLAREMRVSPTTMTVDISFVHPDSQPAGPEWANNVFFEGTSFKLDADRHESLISTLWFAAGSINQAAQRAALDASKLGKPALQVIDTVAAGDRAAIESDALTDLAAVMRQKTRMLLETDLGFGNLDIEFYNAVYKDMKIRHFVRGNTPEGEAVLLTAEQVIEHQLTNPGTPLPVENAELWVPSDDVLRSMLGEQGGQGVTRQFNDQIEIDPAMVPTFRGVTPKMMERFAEGIAGERLSIEQTELLRRGRESQLKVRTMLDDKTRNAFDEKMRYFADLQTQVHTDRAEAQRSEEFGFNAGRNLTSALRAASDMLNAESLTIVWSKLGIPIGPRKVEDQTLSRMLLRDLTAAMATDQNGRTGWIYREGSSAAPQTGLLSQVSLGGETRQAYRVAPGDLVVVEIDSFAGDAKLARRRIEFLSGRGAIIALGATDGQADLRAELAEFLLSESGYTSIIGSSHVYQPGEFGSRFQNQKAHASTLTTMRGISAKSRLAILNVRGLGIQEGAAWVNHDNENLGAVAVSTNLVPVSAMAGFNVPVEQFTNESQVERVRQHLRGFDSASGRTFLRDQANGHISDETERATADAELDAALDRLYRRLDDNPGTVLPVPGDEFGTGDIIPLVDNTGRVLLYRHGMKALNRDQIDELTAWTRPESQDAANIAIFPSKREPSATTHTGTVVSFSWRAGFGLQVELNIDLQVYGDKKQLEWNGMKYVLAPKPDSIVLPDHGFFPNRGIDMISDQDTLFSKEAFGDLIDNHAMAFAFFGIDFTSDVTEFFFPGQRDSADAQVRAREMLHTIATRAPRVDLITADEMLNADRVGAALAEMIPDTVANAVAGVKNNWLADLADLTKTENRIAASLIIYLMTPGARVSDVLRSGGMNDTSNTLDGQSVVMPSLFTQVFDNAPLGSELRREINSRFNGQLNNPNGTSTGYVIDEDFTFHVRNENPEKNLSGFLQFAEAHSAGDNPVKNGMSFDETERGAVSAHTAAIVYGSTGAQTSYAYDLAKVQAYAEGAGLTRFQRDELDGGTWRMLTAIPKVDKYFRAQRMQTPAEAEYAALARDAKVQFRQPIKTDDAFGWTQRQRTEYEELTKSIVRELGMLDGQNQVVDFWVRQVLGMPYGLDEANEEQGKVTGKGAIEAAKDIQWNVKNRYLPTVGAEVPMLHLHDLQQIFRSNQHKTVQWKPRESMDGSTASAESWSDWVTVALGSALTTDTLFDPLYRLGLDGMMHDYQNATRSLMGLPVSVDVLVAMKLADPDFNSMFLSVSDPVNTTLMEPMLLDSSRSTIEEVLGGRRIAGKFRGKSAPASEVAKRREARRKWRKENGVPIPVDVTMRNFRKNGLEAIDSGTTTNSLVRSLINLRVGTALLNPALWISMGPEQWIRGGLDRAANLLTGQATTGLTARTMARTSEALEGTKVGAAAEAVGLTYRYTPDQLTKLNNLYRTLGQRSDFRAMIYKDLSFLQFVEPGMGKVEKATQVYARAGARMQDPTWGMRADTMARRYLEAALQNIEATPTMNVISIENLVAQMMTKPNFLQDQFPEAHQAGLNSIAQIRSLKETVASQLLKGIYEPLAQSSNLGVNLFGNIVLKIPLLFSGYATNVATTILGLQGLNDMTAMMIDGRQKGPNSILGRVQAKLRGDEFDATKDAVFDMSTVTDGIDLSRSFIRGGLTHTGLFVAGMMAGGLGLSGEDEEMKRKRRLAQHQGLGVIYDPRRLEQDFRNSDALYLDALPFGIGNLFEPDDGTGRAPAQMHWMLKQFVSPVMGIEKFFETGDYRQVVWGFQDAIASFPLVNTQMWKDVVSTSGDLVGMADESAADGTDEGAITALGFLARATGTYERMLFESSFVNQIYIGMDRYDRNPYVLPLRDSDGDLQKDIEGNSRPQNIALDSFLDPATGEIRQGYLGRNEASQQAHILAENRATFGFVMSLFTGGLDDSDYWRYNMPIKTREIEKEPMTVGEAKAMVLAAFQGANAKNGIPNVTDLELEQVVREEMAKVDGFFSSDAQVLPVAEQYAKQAGRALLVETDELGREFVTEDGAKATFRGLFGGTLKFGDEALGGVYIPYEMREKITNDITRELMQEGIDLGLDKSKATSRVKRIMGGYGEGETGLNEIIWSDQISYEDKQTYAQLNTTFVMGPDGMPWATGFQRDKLMNALGLNPVKRMIEPEHGGMDVDSRMNSVDLINGNNTGLRALEPLNDTRNVPTDIEIAKKLEDAIREAAKQDFTPFTPFAPSASGGGYGGYGSGWRNFGGSGWQNWGSGGYSSGGNFYFSKMYSLPDNQAPYGNSMSFINTSNPIIRRATVRRERIQSDRGRLNQWQ